MSDAVQGAGAKPITNDMINHPPHYTQGKYECVDVIEDVVKEYDVSGFPDLSHFRLILVCFSGIFM